jgi:D-3-phosphoglycerate dehydrogenase
MAERHAVWFERPVLPELRGKVEARVEMLGPPTEADPCAGLSEAHGSVVGASSFDAEWISRAPQMQVIARTGIGVDKVDIGEATRRGIVVCNAPDGPTISTAEHAVALILAVAKDLQGSARRLQAGETNLYAGYTGVELAGKTLGLVGYGRIARRVAEAGRGLGMNVVAYDPYCPPGEFGATASVGSLEQLLAAADVVSIHIPLTEETSLLFDAAAFGAMKEGAVFVNTARGGLVDHNALLAALESGRLFGAGLDVTEPEPLPPDHPLLSRDDVIVTPHIASGTADGKRRLFETAFEQVLMVLAGERPPHVVNPEVWDRQE